MHRAFRLAALACLLSLAGCSGPDIAWQSLGGAYLNAPTPPLPYPLTFDPEDGAALDHDRVAPDTSSWLADLFVHVPYGVMFAVAAFLAWHHRRRALVERAFDPRAPLADGEAVVFGTVEPLPDWQGPVVRVDIHQSGREWQHKGSWSHNWTETSRAVNRRPFVIVRDDGVRVQVEPDDRVVVRDELSRVVRHSLNQRTRIAEIAPGERVHVTGVLTGASASRNAAAAGAYRAGFATPVLRAPSIGRMVISAERPGDTSLARMAFYRNWAVGLALAFAFAAGVVMPAYELLSLTGEVSWGVPTEVRNWREWHKPKNSSGYWVYRYSVRAAEVRDGETLTFEDDTGAAPHRCVVEGRCPRVPFYVSTVAPSWHQFGTGASLSVGRAVILGILCVILLIAFPASAAGTRPWYLKKKVVDGGGGPLSASQP